MESLIHKCEWKDNNWQTAFNDQKDLLQLYLNVSNQDDVLNIDSIQIEIGGMIINKISGGQMVMHNMIQDNKIDLQVPAIKAAEFRYQLIKITCIMKSKQFCLPQLEMLYQIAQISSSHAHGFRSVQVLQYQEISHVSANNLQEEKFTLPFYHSIFQIAVAFFDDENHILSTDIVTSLQLELNGYDFLQVTDKKHWLYLDKLMNQIPIDKNIQVLTLTFEKQNCENKKDTFTLNASRIDSLILKIKWSELKSTNPVRFVIRNLIFPNHFFFHVECDSINLHDFFKKKNKHPTTRNTFQSKKKKERILTRNFL